MLQMVIRIFLLILSASVCSCNQADIKGLFIPPKDGVDERFEQSMEMNDGLHAGAIDTEESYTFYVAADPHIKDTYRNLGIFNDALKNDGETSFAAILGDCIDVKDNLALYLEALAYYPDRHSYDPEIFHILGNHDIFFNGWEDFRESVGASAYWFEAVFPNGKDMYITLDTASGTLGRKQMQWFKTFLAENRNSYRHCVILTHTNLFYRDNSQTGSGNMPLDETFDLIDFLSRQNVSLVLQGHDHHREDLTYGNVRYTVLGTIRDESKTPEYLKVNVSKDGISHEWQTISTAD